MKIKHAFFISLITLSIILFINKANAEFIMQSFSSGNSQEYNYSSDETINEKNNNNDSYEIIKVNQPIPLSYKTKEEIFNIRKNAVQSSIFKNPNYYPSDEVFGQIEDGKPWISMNTCVLKTDNRSIITGPSEESRFILNPTALVQIEHPFFYWCNVGENRPNIMLKDIKYIKNKNEIVVTYAKLHTIVNDSFYDFNGVNARDLGYKYVYIDKEKSTFPINFVEQINASNSVFEFQDFIHVGGSCRHQEGCNNGSPLQPMLHFRYNIPNEENKEIYIKLWKNKPNSPNVSPDIVERIIIEKT